MHAAFKRCIVACLAVSALYVPVAAAHEGSDPRLLSPHSSPYGRSYAEWFAEYQEWLNEIPLAVNPGADPASPENCDVEDGRIVFIAGSGADCVIPRGKATGFSTAFWECSTAEGLGETYAELRRCAVQNWARDFSSDVFRTKIWIDGRLLSHPRRWTILTPTPADLIDFPAENLWGATPGPSKSVTKGLFYILHPLSRGTHSIKIQAEHEILGDLTYTYTLKAR